MFIVFSKKKIINKICYKNSASIKKLLYNRLNYNFAIQKRLYLRILGTTGEGKRFPKFQCLTMLENYYAINHGVDPHTNKPYFNAHQRFMLIAMFEALNEAFLLTTNSKIEPGVRDMAIKEFDQLVGRIKSFTIENTPSNFIFNWFFFDNSDSLKLDKNFYSPFISSPVFKQELAYKLGVPNDWRDWSSVSGTVELGVLKQHLNKAYLKSTRFRDSFKSSNCYQEKFEHNKVSSSMPDINRQFFFRRVVYWKNLFVVNIANNHPYFYTTQLAPFLQAIKEFNKFNGYK